MSESVGNEYFRKLTGKVEKLNVVPYCVMYHRTNSIRLTKETLEILKLILWVIINKQLLLMMRVDNNIKQKKKYKNTSLK